MHRKDDSINVTDIIPYEEYSKWEPKDKIAITAGTGKGKSYFIKNELANYASTKGKKILLLVHRKSAEIQFDYDISDKDFDTTIYVRTYQFLETLSVFKKEVEGDEGIVDLDYFDYIVLDEFHYFLDDSGFNINTHLSLKSIIKSNAIQIFMSATPERMIDYLENVMRVKLKRYEMEPEFDNINSLNFIYGINDAKDVIQETKDKGYKSIVFTTAGESRIESYLRDFLDDSLVFVSNNNKVMEKYVDWDKVFGMIENRKFEENLLITTSVMDTAVSLFDEDIKTIVIDLRDINNVKQALGRKRMVDNNDKVDVYIMLRNNSEIQRSIWEYESAIKQIRLFKAGGVLEYLNAYGMETANRKGNSVQVREKDGGDFYLRYNEMYLYHSRKMIDEIYSIYNKGDNQGTRNNYIAFVCKELKQEEYTLIPKTKSNWANTRTEERVKAFEEKKEEVRQKQMIENEEWFCSKDAQAGIKNLLENIELRYKRKQKYTDKAYKSLLAQVNKYSYRPTNSLPEINKQLEYFGSEYELYWRQTYEYKKKVRRAYVKKRDEKEPRWVS